MSKYAKKGSKSGREHYQPLDDDSQIEFDIVIEADQKVKDMEYDLRNEKNELLIVKNNLKRMLIKNNRVEFLSLNIAVIRRASNK